MPYGFSDENYRLFSNLKIGHSEESSQVWMDFDATPDVVGPNLDSGYFISFRKLNYEIKGYEIGVTLGHLNIT